MKGHEILLQERYVISDQAGVEAYPPERHYGVRDRTRDAWAVLPNAVLCWALTLEEAGDALVELRGGPIARSVRDTEEAT